MYDFANLGPLFGARFFLVKVFVPLPPVRPGSFSIDLSREPTIRSISINSSEQPLWLDVE